MFMNSLRADYALSSQGRMQLADCTALARRNASLPLRTGGDQSFYEQAVVKPAAAFTEYSHHHRH